MTRWSLLLLLLTAAASSFAADEDVCSWRGGKVPKLETYERNSIGWTKDSDDVGFLDVNLSLKFPLAPNCISRINPDARLYLAATVRFGQYIGTRDSSPVIGKRFNPKLIWRRITQWDESTDTKAPSDEKASTKTCHENDDHSHCEYIDFAYAHESNGQSIHEPEIFFFKVREEVAVNGRPEFARDYISRGWDYLEIAGRKYVGVNRDTRVDVSLKHYLPYGLLQGGAEEYHDWENDAEGKPRRRVSGLSFLASRFSGLRMSVGLETGYAQPFRYNTLLVEARGNAFQLPVMVFYRNGYESDLALYYKKGWSTGIALEVARF
jgi:hypothetical protein